MKEKLVKGDKVLYHTLGLITPAKVIENDPNNNVVKIELVYRKPFWVVYEEIEMEDLK